jgi:hypothetical protein
VLVPQNGESRQASACPPDGLDGCTCVSRLVINPSRVSRECVKNPDLETGRQRRKTRRPNGPGDSHGKPGKWESGKVGREACGESSGVENQETGDCHEQPGDWETAAHGTTWRVETEHTEFSHFSFASSRFSCRSSRWQTRTPQGPRERAIVENMASRRLGDVQRKTGDRTQESGRRKACMYIADSGETVQVAQP